MVTWDGAPLVAVEWHEEFSQPQHENAPDSLTDAFRQAWELAQRQQTPLSVVVIAPPSNAPLDDEEIDRASEAIWHRVDRWLEAAIPGVSARAVVRTGEPLAEILDELRQADPNTCLLVPSASSQLLTQSRSLVEATDIPVWLRPQPADMPIFLVPCPAGPELAPVLSAAVPLVRDLSGRLLLGATIPESASDSDRERRASEIAQTLQQFDYRTIAGGVKIEVVSGDAAALVRELRFREPVKVVACPPLAELEIPWEELSDVSVWFARRGSALG